MDAAFQHVRVYFKLFAVYVVRFCPFGQFLLFSCQFSGQRRIQKKFRGRGFRMGNVVNET